MKNMIFDLDGTLIDSMPLWDNVGRNFLIQNKILPPDNLEEIFKTMSFEESAGYFIDTLGLKMTVPQIISGIIKMVEAAYITSVPLKEGVYKFLEREYKKGTKMCVLTASEESYVLSALKRLKIDRFFTQVLTCTNLGMSKASPEIYDVAAQKISAAKSETAVFEDAWHAVFNAKKAGFYTVAVYDSAQSLEETKNIKACCDKYILSFNDLM